MTGVKLEEHKSCRPSPERSPQVPVVVNESDRQSPESLSCKPAALYSQLTSILNEAWSVLTGLESRHVYCPRSSFCSGLINMELMSAANTRWELADRGLPSFSQVVVFTVPAIAWQLRLAVLLPAMSVTVGPVILVPEMASEKRAGK